MSEQAPKPVDIPTSDQEFREVAQSRRELDALTQDVNGRKHSPETGHFVANEEIASLKAVAEKPTYTEVLSDPMLMIQKRDNEATSNVSESSNQGKNEAVADIHEIKSESIPVKFESSDEYFATSRTLSEKRQRLVKQYNNPSVKRDWSDTADQHTAKVAMKKEALEKQLHELAAEQGTYDDAWDRLKTQKIDYAKKESEQIQKAAEEKQAWKDHIGVGVIKTKAPVETLTLLSEPKRPDDISYKEWLNMSHSQQSKAGGVDADSPQSTTEAQNNNESYDVIFDEFLEAHPLIADRLDVIIEDLRVGLLDHNSKLVTTTFENINSIIDKDPKFTANQSNIIDVIKHELETAERQLRSKAPELSETLDLIVKFEALELSGVELSGEQEEQLDELEARVDAASLALSENDEDKAHALLKRYNSYISSRAEELETPQRPSTTDADKDIQGKGIQADIGLLVSDAVDALLYTDEEKFEQTMARIRSLNTDLGSARGQSTIDTSRRFNQILKQVEVFAKEKKIAQDREISKDKNAKWGDRIKARRSLIVEKLKMNPEESKFVKRAVMIGVPVILASFAAYTQLDSGVESTPNEQKQEQEIEVEESPEMTTTSLVAEDDSSENEPKELNDDELTREDLDKKFNQPVNGGEGPSHISKRLGIDFGNNIDMWNMYNKMSAPVFDGLEGTYTQNGGVGLNEGARIDPSIIDELYKIEKQVNEKFGVNS